MKKDIVPSLNFRQRAVLFLGAVVVFMTRIVERIEELLKRDVKENPESLSIYGTLALIIPLWFDPMYLANSKYLYVLAQVVGSSTLVLVYAALGLFQAVALLLSGDSSPCVRTERDKRRWLIVRCVGLLFATFVWAVTAGLMTAKAVTTQTIVFGGLAFWSVVWLWRLAFAHKVFRETARALPGSDQVLLSKRAANVPR